MSTIRSLAAARKERNSGERVIYPRGVEKRYGISLNTRLRWERAGRLPARDFFLGGKPKGWRPETLDAADRGDLVP